MVVADDLLSEFLNEATSHLDAADRELAWLSQDGPATILGILRRIHTIRGTAGFLDLPHLDRLRTVEIILDDLRGRDLLPDDAERRVRGALAVARSIVASAGESAPVDRHEPRPSHAEPRRPGLALVVPAVAIDRLCGLAEALASRAADDPSQRGLLIERLGREMAAARRQPLRYAWNKLGRAVDEIAGTTGKAIAFEASGGDETLDYRAVVLLRDALTHVVRNAAHHGIENPDERVSRGKPSTGTIRLSATTGPDEVSVIVTDDGAGLDLDAIRSRAVALGLVDGDRAADLDEASLADLIFAPGFSTSDGVGALSGLGIGLDVVRANIAELGGTVSLDADAGNGLRVAIRLPLRPVPDHAASPRPVVPEAGTVLLAARPGLRRDALRTILSTLGHEVETADDADRALALALGRPYSAIVADQDLPDRPGLDLARAVRRHAPLAGTEFVLVLPPGDRLAEADRRSLGLVTVSHPFGTAAQRGPAHARNAA